MKFNGITKRDFCLNFRNGSQNQTATKWPPKIDTVRNQKTLNLPSAPELLFSDSRIPWEMLKDCGHSKCLRECVHPVIFTHYCWRVNVTCILKNNMAILNKLRCMHFNDIILLMDIYPREVLSRGFYHM